MPSPNKFATALHCSTNRITLLLVYALLEWILIALLLANSLFSYLILCFSDYFGLHPPAPSAPPPNICSALGRGGPSLFVGITWMESPVVGSPRVRKMQVMIARHRYP
ncbi:hypothetical protein MLD38_004412 [Melastoma candidum]|uniref:Uncharacterized protein n=1 Tax=Melastoma candidum TaxID=119954 RepID=A0ACB9SE63_9MYRT|nr:hypothetical protein MLD38_004412 [Melastoma candidum]